MEKFTARGAEGGKVAFPGLDVEGVLAGGDEGVGDVVFGGVPGCVIYYSCQCKDRGWGGREMYCKQHI